MLGVCLPYTPPTISFLRPESEKICEEDVYSKSSCMMMETDFLLIIPHVFKENNICRGRFVNSLQHRYGKKKLVRLLPRVVMAIKVNQKNRI